MDDHRGAAPLGYLLEAIIAAGLICTFFIQRSRHGARAGAGAGRDRQTQPALKRALQPAQGCPARA